MEISKFATIYFVTFLVFLVVDGIWLGLISKDFYAKHLGYLMTDKVNWFAALVFYLIFIFGLIFFVILPALSSGQSLGTTVLHGALFGLVSYATYDLTNQATIKDWPVIVTVVDLIWGAVLSATISTISVYIFKR